MTLEVGVLGPIEAKREGEELTLGGPQQRRLLGVLVAAAGQVVPVVLGSRIDDLETRT